MINTRWRGCPAQASLLQYSSYNSSWPGARLPKNWFEISFVIKEPCDSSKPARAAIQCPSQYKATTLHLSSLPFSHQMWPDTWQIIQGTYCSSVYLNECFLLMTSKRAFQRHIHSGQVPFIGKIELDGICSKPPYPFRTDDPARLDHKSWERKNAPDFFLVVSVEFFLLH